ncbi:MAG: diguanylate cyclase [Magnetovibrio sp.]|nr:diguanylate cyclase [Magnetovibrio sp.]
MRKSVSLTTYVKVVSLCFVVEFITMYLLQNLHQMSPLLAALIDAIVIALTLVVAIAIWVAPDLAKSQQVAKDQAELMKTLINSIPAPIFYKNENGIYTGCNSHFEKYLGRDARDIIGHTVYEVAPKELAEIYHNADMELIQKGESQIYETKVNHADGSEHDVMFHKAAYHKSNGDIGGIIGVILDISERKDMERRLKSLATIDDLTQIPNRRELDHRVQQALMRNQRAGEKLALLFIDMDGFKEVNDQFGHEAGDIVLKEVASRLTNLIRKSDVAGRMGGDEFAVLLDSKVTQDSVSTVAKKLLKGLSEPYHVNDSAHAKLTASIGIAFSPDDGSSLRQLLAQADEAMYAAKNLGKNTYSLARDLSSND